MSDVPLREYVEARLEELEKRIELSDRLRDTALDKAEAAMLVRLTAMNEFREQLNKERSEYVRRDQLIYALFALLSLAVAAMSLLR